MMSDAESTEKQTGSTEPPSYATASAPQQAVPQVACMMPVATSQGTPQMAYMMPQTAPQAMPQTQHMMPQTQHIIPQTSYMMAPPVQQGAPMAQPNPDSYGGARPAPSQPITCSPSLEGTIRVVKVVCWLVMIIPTSIGVKDQDDYKLSSGTFTFEYMLSISVITFVIDAILMGFYFSRHLSQLSQTPTNRLLIAYNGVVILLYYIALRVGIYYFPPLLLAVEETGILVVAYQVFAGIGMAACAAEIFICIKRLKKSSPQR